MGADGIALETLTVGPLATNCYIVRANGGKAIVIDPGDEPERILEVLDGLGCSVELILNTHAHFDHAGADARLARATGAKIGVHRLDVAMLLGDSGEVDWLGSGRLAEEETVLPLEEGDKLSAGDLKLTVLHTPGHTPGSMSLFGSALIFTGDLLFRGSVGRTDLPGGSYTTLVESLKRIAGLEGDFAIYPGHGPATTLDEERRTNPYLDPAVIG